MEMKQIINEMNVTWCWTKIKAMENKSQTDYIFLARDNVKKSKNEKQFTAILVSEMDKIIPEMLKNNNHLYEILPENQLIKLYFDLELEKNGMNNEIAYNILIKFLHCPLQEKYNHFVICFPLL